jgi:hypothetical protein
MIFGSQPARIRISNLLRHGCGLLVAISAIPLFAIVSGTGISFGQALRFSRPHEVVYASGIAYALCLSAHFGICALLAGLRTRSGLRFVPPGWWAIAIALSVVWLAIVGFLFALSEGLAGDLSSATNVGRNVLYTSVFWHPIVFVALVARTIFWTRPAGKWRTWTALTLFFVSLGPLYVAVALLLAD